MSIFIQLSELQNLYRLSWTSVHDKQKLTSHDIWRYFCLIRGGVAQTRISDDLIVSLSNNFICPAEYNKLIQMFALSKSETVFCFSKQREIWSRRIYIFHILNSRILFFCVSFKVGFFGRFKSQMKLIAVEYCR